MEISAKVIADSVSYGGDRLTTFECTFPRFILAEVNTHRVLSRNSASSRAIPVEKMLDKLMNNPAEPVGWPAEQRGMQGGEQLEGFERDAARTMWYDARDAVLEVVEAYLYNFQAKSSRVHKQVINRVLEPWLPHTAIITGTDWAGFFEQRLHPDAQPEFHELAIQMKKEMDKSQPTLVPESFWHRPYVTLDEIVEFGPDVATKVSVARCARVSYLTHDGVRDIDKDIELYNRLAEHKPAHASPFEHVATPFNGVRNKGNFTGWTQLRHILELG